MVEEALWEDAEGGRSELRERKRRAVLQAAARLFTERGYDRTSLDDIAKALGVSKRTIYYYVENKEDIMSACGQLATDWLQTPLTAARDQATPPLERLRAFMREYLRLIRSDFGACMVAAREFPLSEAARERVLTGIRGTDALVRDLIREGQRDGSIGDCDPAYAAAAIFGAFNWSTRWLNKDDDRSVEEAADKLLHPLIEGMRRRG